MLTTVVNTSLATQNQVNDLTSFRATKPFVRWRVIDGNSKATYFNFFFLNSVQFKRHQHSRRNIISEHYAKGHMILFRLDDVDSTFSTFRTYCITGGHDYMQTACYSNNRVDASN
jgi:hypothetical protein